MNALGQFARLLCLRQHNAEPALHSERAAKFVLNRRQFLGATALGTAAAVVPFRQGEVEAAMTGRTLHSLPARSPLSTIHLLGPGGKILQRWYPGERVNGVYLISPIRFGLQWFQGTYRLVRVGKHVLAAWNLGDGSSAASAVSWIPNAEYQPIA